MFRILLPALLAAGLAAPASATVLFSDSFDTAVNVLNVPSLPGWTITGQVDHVAAANGFGIGTCVSGCVDLDGSPGPGQLLSDPIAFAAGDQVLISFDVSGNQRGGAADEFIFEGLFDSALTYNANIITGFAYGAIGIFTDTTTGTYLETIASGRPFLTYTFGFIPTTAGSVQLRLATTSGDSVGPILDNVLVTQVPEPATWAMLITGFGLVGASVRLRNRGVGASLRGRANATRRLQVA